MNHPDVRDFMNPDASDVVNLYNALRKELMMLSELSDCAVANNRSKEKTLTVRDVLTPES